MKTHGGKRKNAGRKKLPPELKKVPITIYVTRRSLDEYGIERAKERARLAIEN